MMEYAPRPDPVGMCKCGHKYTKHRLTDSHEQALENGSRWKKLYWNLNLLSIGWDIFRTNCHECMCPMYEQEKIVDEKTGIEIPKLENEK